jgi:hypothetical protein
MPIFYECQRCTACCRWPGQVKLSEDEITRIAAFLEQDENTFIQNSTRLSQSRKGLALQDQSNGSCIFLKDDKCSIQSVKPQQCRDFPNLWNFPGFEKTCKAIPKDLSPEAFKESILQATGRDIQTRDSQSQD